MPLPRTFLCLGLGLVSAGALSADPISFRKVVLNSAYYCDGIDSGDINRDGAMDIVAGPYWYQGPSFRVRHAFYDPIPLDPAASPSNSMFSFVHDFNRDGWLDILVLGRVHLHQAFWYANPGENDQGLWEKHFVFHRVRGESPALVDIDRDGRPELICHWDNRWGWIEPQSEDPYAPWQFRSVSLQGDYNQFYHGTGVGDLNGDGRLDLVINDGWWEQPAEERDIWEFHAQRLGEKGGAQILVDDVNRDGRADLISSLDAHGWGLAWFEQQAAGEGSIKRMMMGSREEESKYGVAFSQPHAMALGDLNGDGRQDVVVGKRRWAHGPSGDVEPNAAPVIYWFEAGGKPVQREWKPHVIDDESGVGVQNAVKDVNGDERLDVLAASKLGTFVFLNEMKKSTPERQSRSGVENSSLGPGER